MVLQPVLLTHLDSEVELVELLVLVVGYMVLMIDKDFHFYYHLTHMD